jgi:hypothetical protein
MCLRLWSRPAIGLAAIILIYLVGVVLGIGFSIRAATHPLLDPVIRRPWRYLAAVFCLDIVIGQFALVAEHREVGHHPSAVGDHHGGVGQHPAAPAH